MKKILLLIIVFLSSFANAQCPYPTSSNSDSFYSICINNPNSFSTSYITEDQILLYNVIQGFQYRFNVGDVYPSLDENINVYNGATNSYITHSTGSAGTLFFWTATFTGQIKVAFSSGACIVDSDNYFNLTVGITGVGNTLDSQTTSASGAWVGHVYNWVSSQTPAPAGVPSPASPTNSHPFTASNYVGYYNVPTETITENFGGNDVCFPVLSNGVVRSTIRTETFAVRYRMTSTRPAGCYIIRVKGSDGVRLYNNGALVFNEWRDQTASTYTNILVHLAENAELIFDYYENTADNVAELSIVPFDASTNTIAVPANTTVCSEFSPGSLNGSSYIYNGSSVNPTVSFQWQVSSDNITFTNIAGATNEDYTPPGISNLGPGNTIKYYRRVVDAVSSLGSCTSYSNVISITTTVAPVAPTAITGTTSICSGTSTTLTATAGLGTYEWGTGSTVGTNSIAGQTTNTLATGNLSSTTTYWVRVKGTSPCGDSSGISTTVTVTPAAVVPTAITGTISICSGTSTTLTATAGLGTYEWGTGATVGTNPIAGQTTNTLATGNLSTTTTYWVRVKGTSPCGDSAGKTVIVTVNALPVAPTVGTITQPTCAVATGSVALSGLPASGTWTLTRTPGNATSTGTGTTTTISGLASGTYTYTVTNANGCKSAASNSVIVAANPNSGTNSDGDSKANICDLDDDNDGILDTDEGCDNSGSGVCLDTDGDGIIDSLDLDSDNDGCSDANEYYNSVTAQGTDGNQYYGTGNPPATNSDGKVTAASYVSTTAANVKIATQTSITTHPSNVNALVGSNASFSISATSTNTSVFASGVPNYASGTANTSNLKYQWQVSTDSGNTWVNLANGGVYSNVTTSTLNLTSITNTLNNNQYRTLVTAVFNS